MSRLLTLTLAFVITATAASAQARKPIAAQDGDIILVPDTARIRIVRRKEGNARIIHDAARRWVLVLFDQAKGGSAPDGRVDHSYTFNAVEGDWPLGERWEGYVTLDDYSVAGEPPNQGMGVMTPAGLIQILGGGSRGDARPSFKDASAIATITFSGSGTSSGSNLSFDDTEQRQVENAMRNASSLPTPSFRTSVGMSVSSSGGGGGVMVSPSVSSSPAPSAPIRVGGTVATPRRIQDALPVTPDAARQAGVLGVVILEIVVGVDGSVSDAKVLRSIPLLDQAAIDTARQWRYTPTLLNGAPVPVIMTATVNFR